MARSAKRNRVQSGTPTTLTTCLTLLAVIAACAGMFPALGRLLSVAAAGETTVLDWALAGCYVLAGWFAGAILWAAAWMVRLQYDSLLRQRRGSPPPRAASAADRTDAAPASATEGQPTQQELLNRMLSELSETNANLLLSQAQREAKGRRRLEVISRELKARIDEAIADGQFARAEKLLENLIESVPDDPDHAGLSQKLLQERRSAEIEDVRRYTRQAENMMSAASFHQAQVAAEELLSMHPDCDKAVALVERVRRETQAFVTEQRLRLYGQVERNAQARRWRAALAAGRRLLESHPNSGEADAVSAQMPTIRENARIEEVREIRDRIRDLLERRRFSEAVIAAEDLTERFPDTQAANELREQMSRLRELAKTQAPGAPRRDGDAG